MPPGGANGQHVKYYLNLHENASDSIKKTNIITHLIRTEFAKHHFGAEN